MRFGGQVFDEFVGEHDRANHAAEIGERAVVVAGAATEPVAVVVDRDGRNQRELTRRKLSWLAS